MDLNRREFLKTAGAAVAATGVCGCGTCGRDGREFPIALQLWSVHKIFWQEPERNLARIKEIGYDGVEFAGYENRTAKQIGKMLRDAGLRGAGTHLSGIKANFSGDALKRNVEFCVEAGIEAIGNSWSNCKTPEAWTQFGVEMGEAADYAKEQAGIPVQVHNHAHNFSIKYGGVSAWQFIFREASKNLLLQLDTSQVVGPGEDVVAEIERYPNRHFSIHVKENVPSADGFFGVPPDDGGKMVPWRETVDCIRRQKGFRWFIVECERRPDSFVPAAYNVDFLRKLI